MSVADTEEFGDLVHCAPYSARTYRSGNRDRVKLDAYLFESTTYTEDRRSIRDVQCGKP